HSPIGPEGTVLIQDGKVWLESKDGTYTIDIPQEFQYEKIKEGSTFLRSIHDEQAFIAFTPALDIRKVPSLEEAEKSFRSSLLRQTELRRDLTEFAGNPASTIQAKVIPLGENDRPDYDGTTLQVLTEIGNTRWGLAFSTASREEVEALMQQAADSLTKQ
ncbi:hypothetical protein, partial [Buchananella hordeovulneris]|uniref:hypothetical protein n=1 Tax=Buchananella hordeovulneris TaxID=52770 RepID=UPI001639C06E